MLLLRTVTFFKSNQPFYLGACRRRKSPSINTRQQGVNGESPHTAKHALLVQMLRRAEFRGCVWKTGVRIELLESRVSCCGSKRFCFQKQLWNTDTQSGILKPWNMNIILAWGISNELNNSNIQSVIKKLICSVLPNLISPEGSKVLHSLFVCCVLFFTLQSCIVEAKWNTYEERPISRIDSFFFSFRNDRLHTSNKVSSLSSVISQFLSGFWLSFFFFFFFRPQKGTVEVKAGGHNRAEQCFLHTSFSATV